MTSSDNFFRHYRGFVQDEYRVTPKLTLNLGLSFEYRSGLQEERNRLITGFDATAANPLQNAIPGLPVPGRVIYAGVDGAPAQTGNALRVMPAVRIGIAQAIDRQTVVRVGYGIFWVPAPFNRSTVTGYSQTTSIVSSTNNNITPAASLSHPYPNGLLQPTGNTLGGLSGVGQPIAVYSDSARSAGYVQEFSLELQRDLPQGFVLTLGGAGSRGVHMLESVRNIDQLNPALFNQAQAQVKATPSVINPFRGNGGVGTIGTATVSPVQLLLPFPQYTSLSLLNADTGNSRYYEFYLRAQRRVSAGLSLLASYAWSRSQDDLANETGPQNAYNVHGEWSLSKQDAPNRFTSVIAYDLPAGKRSLAWLTGGWSANVAGAIQSGNPLQVTQSNNNSVFGAGYQRPNATGISAATSGSTGDRIGGWLNPAAFSQAAPYTFGNVSRFVSVRGPGLFNWDVSLSKSFAVRERVKAQFRAEALNATNTVNFGNPQTNIDSPNFGQITSQINRPRAIQVGFRVTF